MKKLTLLLACFTTAILSRGQDNNFNRSPVTLTSPDAAQFIRYGDVPVDYSTGVPNISIPLYKVTCGNLSLPIDISYNASGIKVLDIAGTAGLGWNLNAGGLVSRTQLGISDVPNQYRPDLFALFNEAHNNTNYSNVCNFTETVNDAFLLRQETQSDRYFYSFNGRSGIFRIDFQTGIAKTIPYSPLKIVVNSTGTYKITAEDGTNYYFEQPELSYTTASSSSPSYTSYYLTKIESPDLTHTINIYYKPDGSVSQLIKNYQLERSIGFTGLAFYDPFVTTQIRDNEFTSISLPVMPDSITSDNETVLFQYTGGRPDLRNSRLSTIKILNRVTRETIRIIDLQQSYFGTASANNQRLRLDNLNIKDKSSTMVQQYSFGYNSTPLPPYYHSFGMSEHHNVDYWGYYNGADDPNLLPKELFNPTPNGFPIAADPRFTYQEQQFYGGNRNPNPATAQACMLTSITYPTGGKTDFEYELNKVASGYSYPNSLGDDFGGLRVKKITSTADAASPPVIKTYKYTGWFHTMIENELYLYSTASTIWGQIVGYVDPETPITYPINNVSSVINTDPLMPMSTGSGPLVIYDNVIEYDGTEENNNGSVEYIYDNSSIPYQFYDPGTYGNPSFWGFYLTDYGNYKPQLKAKVFYGNGQNNITAAIKSEEYTYNIFNSGSFITGVKVQRNDPFVKLGSYANSTDCSICTGGSNTPAEQQLALSLLLAKYQLTNTTAILDVPLLVQKKETILSSTGTGDLTTTTDYTYDLVTLQPIQEQSTNSKGEIFKKQLKYPRDYPSTEPYTTMVNRNIVTPVIEQLTFKDASPTPLQATRTNYNFWNGSTWSATGTNIIVPQTVETKSLSQTSYETRLRYNNYDSRGNIATVSKENDTKTSYLWAYNKTYPVASVVNADVKDIFHTSFEEGDGNSTSGDCKTGNQSKTNGFSTSLSNLTNGNYILSYWQKSGASWTLQKSTVAVTSGTYSISLTGQIDEVRFYPELAMMTTFTYSPLIGMTSQSDANGRTTYYEYDAFNRLMLIRDQDKKIIKIFCYNYAGQVENCNIPCTYTDADWQNTSTAIRCQQGSCGNTGYQEQEQKDMNACSPTYNQTQWVVVGYNATACPVTCVNLTSTNVTAATGYTASYYNTTTGVTYNFAVAANIHLHALGAVPAGNYTLTISRTSGPQMYGTFKSGCFRQTSTGTSAVFTNVAVSATTCNSITVDISGN